MQAKDSSYLVVVVIFFIFIPVHKVKPEAVLFKRVMAMWTVLTVPVLRKTPVEVWLLHKGTAIKVVEEVRKTEVEAVIMFIFRVNGVIIF